MYTSLSGECIRASVKNNDGFKTLFGCGAITASLLMEICRVIYYSSSAHCKESLLGEQAYIVGAFLSLSHECTLELMYLLFNYIL
jgi:hypothetical protein